MHDLIGALFLNTISFWTLSFLFAAAAKRSIVPFTTIHEYMHDIFLLAEYWPLDKSFPSTHFFVTNLDTVESCNNLDVL